MLETGIEAILAVPGSHYIYVYRLTYVWFC